MDCHEIKRISAGYLEDAIPTEQHYYVRDHLDKCPLCAAVMKQMQMLRERVRLALCKDCCPGNLRQRITQRFQALSASEDA